jgi:iron(III) transport system substrate-binding protein
MSSEQFPTDHESPKVRKREKNQTLLCLSASLFSVLLLMVCGCTKSSERVVVYSAQDQEFAERVFASLQPKLGFQIAPKFDTEANKSVSLVAELEAEAQRPRADVHWNNEILGTIRLARAGVYEPYTSGESANYPAGSATGLYHRFAERARVIIVNTDKVPLGERPTSLFDLMLPKWKDRVAMAKPQFGTTATHAACLWEVLGEAGAKAFFEGLKANGVQIVAGNKAVAVGVAKGDYALGMTDSDDAMIEMLAGKPVAIILPDATGHPQHSRLGTLYLPNTLAIIRGGPNPDAAKKLVDQLLSREVESQLATGGGFQLPLRTDLAALRGQVLKTPAANGTRMQVDFERAADLWETSQAYLRLTFAR